MNELRKEDAHFYIEGDKPVGGPEVVEQMVRIHTKAEQRKDKTQTSGTAESRSTVDAVYHHQQAFDTY
jgi:hypothetical protein